MSGINLRYNLQNRQWGHWTRKCNLHFPISMVISECWWPVDLYFLYTMPRRKFYVRDAVVPFEEDAFHEFKGHRNLAVEELPPWCYIPGTDRRSRKAVSRAINGFLNTGKGGTVYLGIVDEGTAKGIRLSQYQKDHVLVSLSDLMNRYKPQVDSERYSIEFVPVLMPKEDIDSPFEEGCVEKSGVDRGRLKAHLLRTPDYCWCDRDAMAQYSLGIEQREYVIEITIHPYEDKLIEIWNDKYRLNLHPVYEDEEGRCYFRRQASLVQYDHLEIYEQTKEEVRHHYEPVINKLKKDLQDIRLHLHK